MVKAALPQLIVNVALPLIAYLVLRSIGWTVVWALVCAGGFPALGVVVKFIRSRRLDRFGLLMLLVIAVGSVLSLVSGDPRFVLAKESVITGGIGLVLIGSLLLPRPAMFYLWRWTATMKGPDRAAAWDAKWDTSSSFRRSQRVLTAGVGLMCIVEAGIRIGLTFVLPPSVMLVVSGILPLVFLAALFPWMMKTFTNTWSDKEAPSERPQTLK